MHKSYDAPAERAHGGSLEAEILERRLVEAELRRSKDELAAFLDTAAVGLHWVAPDGVILWANPADYELLGYARDEYVGRHIADFHADQPVIDDILARLSRGERIRDREARLKCKDGSIKTVLIDSSVLWHGGRFIHTQCFTRDITAQKRAEDQNRLLAAVIESTDDAIISADLDGVIRSWNRSAERVYGFAKGEMIGRRLLLTVPEDRHEESRRLLARIIAGEPVIQTETIRRRKDGTLFDAALKLSPVRDAGGRIIGASAIVRDVTAQKRSEEAGHRLAAIVESSDDAIVGEGLDGTIRTWNGAAERLLGYSAREAVGESILMIIPPRLHGKEHEILRQIAAGKRVDHYETVRVRKDGTRIEVSLTISPIRDARGEVVGASKILRDITERKRSEEALRKAREELGRSYELLEARVRERTASLLEAVSQVEEFSYTVSHDLRAPLRAMQTYSKALLEDFGELLDQAPEAKRYLGKISSNASRLDRMILDVLTFSRVSRAELKLQRVSLDRLVREIIENYPGMQPPKARVSVAPLSDVVGHEPSLTQAVSNLLTNAVKFVAPGTRPEVRVWTDRDGAAVRLWVEDNGIGVEPRYHGRLFKMFERVHPKLPYEGTGVGLAIVRRAVERMGGKVGVESAGAGGSRFWFELPAADASA